MFSMFLRFSPCCKCGGGCKGVYIIQYIMDLHSGLPYWVVKNSLLDYFHPLEDDFSTDIVVVGSGITGALMVHELCSAGLRCCMVDKRSIATGSSIASTALLQYEIDVPLCEMAEIIGEDNAVSAYRASLASIADIEKVLKETGVDADFEKRPSLFYASIPKDIELIEKEYVIRKKHNLPVRLLEKEEIPNENAKEYLEVLERQSARLKKLIEDLIEASKASSGSLSVNLEKLEAGVFLVQTVGEFKEKTEKNKLDLQIKKPGEPIYIMADGRHFWRVIDNLMNNICKYAQPETRVYINLEQTGEKVQITFRNTSRYPLNISSEELMERFVRGDSSRNTEGNGLGLSIAGSLMELMHGKMQLFVDGDLFKVVLEFDRCEAS